MHDVQPNHYPIIAKFLPSKELTAEEAKNIPPVGNSPVFFTLEQMRKIIPLWAELNLAMYKDQEASKVRRQRGPCSSTTTSRSSSRDFTTQQAATHPALAPAGGLLRLWLGHVRI